MDSRRSGNGSPSRWSRSAPAPPRARAVPPRSARAAAAPRAPAETRAAAPQQAHRRRRAAVARQQLLPQALGIVVERSVVRRRRVSPLPLFCPGLGRLGRRAQRRRRCPPGQAEAAWAVDRAPWPPAPARRPSYPLQLLSSGAESSQRRTDLDTLTHRTETVRFKGRYATNYHSGLRIWDGAPPCSRWSGAGRVGTMGVAAIFRNSISFELVKTLVVTDASRPPSVFVGRREQHM